MSTLRQTSVRRKGSVTIPCHYENKYKSYVKTWCSGYSWTSCKPLQRTDSPITDSDKVSISDDPAQGVFTVTLRRLETRDSGWYWCAVETGGNKTHDDRASLYLIVTEDAAVPYVVNPTITGQIGGGVSVQCRYGHPYRGSQKQWCRSGDWSSCQTAGSPGTAGHGSVLITDHTAEGLFSVTVSGLRPEDQGWYWCDIGNQQLPVHLQVTEAVHTAPPTGQSSSLPPEDKHGGDEGAEKHNASSLTELTLNVLGKTTVFLLFLTCSVIAIRKIWKNRTAKQDAI
ncbi:polymeric immunoglobulin receptor-like isoform X2 [Amia ocellicauda]|uniref:polymeric immunoglobulin receptor-like isoform X2 n=1 Tax=Amia ocellicauda TaxID=2972642 RepID=UPI003464A1EE